MLVPYSDFATEGQQPMEVAPRTEAASTVENQPVEDPPSSRFTWTIENFSRLNTKKHYSDVFFVDVLLDVTICPKNTGSISLHSTSVVSKQKPRVCILGGGFGGLYTALRLESLEWPHDKKPQECV